MYDPTDGCPECGTVSRIHEPDCEYVNREPDPEPTEEELAAMYEAWRESNADQTREVNA